MENDLQGIARQMASGETSAFELLFRTYYPQLVRYATTITDDRESAEEIVQDLFYRLWRDREKLMIGTSVTGYLYRSVYNRAIKFIDHQKIKRRYITTMTEREDESPVTPYQETVSAELSEIIARTIENMPDRCAEIFCLNRFEGLKYREIADRLSISIKTVEANMGKALREFRKVIEDYKTEPKQ